MAGFRCNSIRLLMLVVPPLFVVVEQVVVPRLRRYAALLGLIGSVLYVASRCEHASFESFWSSSRCMSERRRAGIT